MAEGESSAPAGQDLSFPPRTKSTYIYFYDQDVFVPFGVWRVSLDRLVPVFSPRDSQGLVLGNSEAGSGDPERARTTSNCVLFRVARVKHQDITAAKLCPASFGMIGQWGFGKVSGTSIGSLG